MAADKKKPRLSPEELKNKGNLLNAVKEALSKKKPKTAWPTPKGRKQW